MLNIESPTSAPVACNLSSSHLCIRNVTSYFKISTWTNKHKKGLHSHIVSKSLIKGCSHQETFWFLRSSVQIVLLYLPTQIHFPIRGKCVVCRGSKLTNSLGQTNLTNSLGNQQQHELLTTHDQAMLLETVANLWASLCKANDFFAMFSTFELGGITKHLMTGPAGNCELSFPLTSIFPSALPQETLRVSAKQKSLFPLRPVIKCVLLHTGENQLSSCWKH